MAVSNRDRVSRAMELVHQGLFPFVDRMLRPRKGATWAHEFNDRGQLKRRPDGTVHVDAASLLKAIDRHWGEVFSTILDRTCRAIANELVQTRNRWAHDEPFNSADTLRALDSAKRLLEAVSAKAQAEEIDRHHHELMRTVFEEQARNKTRYKGAALESQPRAGLKPWREIVRPHPDVASGRYAQAEFAADLAQVHRGEGAEEYRDPAEFFRRTFLTEGLTRLLSLAMLRLSGRGGDPVIELHTNFGGGKTHSMLALYHLADHPRPASLPGVDGLMREAGLAALPRARKAVLVGTALSPGQPAAKPDGTGVNTLWGELAWQLGGPEGYGLVALSDRNGVSPGADILSELLKRFSPCLVLVDEWVAYVRQLYHVPGLPAGSFDANLTFAHALTEAAKSAPQALLVASLPASAIEIGGSGGEEALKRLRNTFSRVEASWQPASADEGFEIVRRRLFEPVIDRDLAAHRDAVVRAYGELYRAGPGEYPPGCGEGEYGRRMQAAYPIHPELFERLYNDWGSLDKFQRTRGVLRFMAAAIHALWEREDNGLTIQPASIPVDSPLVQGELTRYLDQNWSAVLAKDVDGPTSIPVAIDAEVPTLGRISAARRVARTVWMGSAPNLQGKAGLDDRRIKLGCTQPGESAGTFGDALRRLADQATYLYQDGARYWFSTQPSVARLAEDRAAQIEPAEIEAAIVALLRRSEERRGRGDFAAIHVAPADSGEVPDEGEARLVILGPSTPHLAKNGGGLAIPAARAILDQRGSRQRLYRNALLFLAPDAGRLRELETALRSWRAWTSIAGDHEILNLDPFQRRQAETRRGEFERIVETRLLETWCWALAPHQPDPRSPEIDWTPTRLQGEGLVARAARKFVQEEALITRLGPGRLKLALDTWLWRDRPHVATRQLWDWMASYLYLPRLRDQEVLRRAIEEAIGGLVGDILAYAEGYDEGQGRYLGLRATGGGAAAIDGHSLVVRPEVAAAQRPTPASPPEPAGAGGGLSEPDPTGEPGRATGQEPPPRRYTASVALDPARSSREMGRIAEEVLAHLQNLPGASLRITLAIEAELPGGVPEDVRRTVTENGHTLKFRTQGFEAA